MYSTQPRCESPSDEYWCRWRSLDSAIASLRKFCKKKRSSFYVHGVIPLPDRSGSEVEGSRRDTYSTQPRCESPSDEYWCRWRSFDSAIGSLRKFRSKMKNAFRVEVGVRLKHVAPGEIAGGYEVIVLKRT